MSVVSEASLDTLMWLKLLFVPTLGIVILTLFLLEEYCYAHAEQQHQQQQQQQQHQIQQQQQQHAQQQHAHQQQQQMQHTQHGHSHGGTNGSTIGLKEEITSGGSRLMQANGGAHNHASGKDSLHHRPVASSAPLLAPPLILPSASSMAVSGQYSYPFTLLSPRTAAGLPPPPPSLEYPELILAPLAAKIAPQQGTNPQSLLASSPKSVLAGILANGISTAAQGHINLLGHPASFPPTAAAPNAVRINVMNEAGESLILSVTQTTTLRDLFTHYLSRQNLACWSGQSTAPSTAHGSSSTSTGMHPPLSQSVLRFTYKGKPLENEKASLLSMMNLIPSATSMNGATTHQNQDTSAGPTHPSSPHDADECAILHVSMDWEQLYLSLGSESQKELDVLHARLDKEAADLAELESAYAKLNASVDHLRNDVAASDKSAAAQAADKTRLLGDLERAKADLATATADLAADKKRKLEAEGSDVERLEVKKIEKQRAGVKRQIDEVQVDLNELQTKQAKLEKECATLCKEAATVREKTNTLEEELIKLAPFANIDETNNNNNHSAGAGTNSANSTSANSPISSASAPSSSVNVLVDSAAQPNSATSTAPPTLASLTNHLELLERQFGELQIQRRKVEFITSEIAHKRSEVHTLARKVQVSTSLAAADASSDVAGSVVAAAAAASAVSGIAAAGLAGGPLSASTSVGPPSKLDALPSLRARAAQLEKDTKDLLRWKSIAKHLDLEARDAYRWKSLLRAAMAREVKVTTESAAKVSATLQEWRRRTSALEKEAVELRAWRRTVLGDGPTAGSGAAGPTGGDFYPSPAAAAAAGIGLGLGIAYDHSDSMLHHHSSVGGGLGDHHHHHQHALNLLDHDLDDTAHGDPNAERIEPLSKHMMTVLAEENAIRSANANASAGASSTPSVVGALDSIQSHGMSDDLFAAEQEEEHLVASMAQASMTSATRSAEAEEEDLFKLGEALVRRNQHLHQHRLMIRYQQQQQQQQQQAILQQQPQHGSNGILSSNDAIGGMVGIESMLSNASNPPNPSNLLVAPSANLSNLYQPAPNKAGLTGVLQASAPVFTPRYQTAEAGPLVAPNTPSASAAAPPVNAVPTMPSHYTKVVSGGVSSYGNSASTGAPSLSWTNPSGHTPPVSTPASTSSVGSLDIDSSGFWNSSLQSLLDEMDSAHAIGGPTQHQRARAFSNPPAHTPTHMTTPNMQPTTSGINYGLSSLPPSDPFTGFRRSQGLVLIDDDTDDAPRDPSLGGMGLPLDSYHPFGSRPSASPLGSGVHSGASSPSAQLFATPITGSGNGLPTFFLAGQQ